MEKAKSILKWVLLGLGTLFAVVVVGGLAAPHFAEGIRSMWAQVPSGKGTSGLIYVESPEVYTRQRLVNDRYLQDAWLRDQLDVIDKPTTDWIDTESREVRQAKLTFNKSDTAEAAGDQQGEDAAEIAEATDSPGVAISFTEKFKLQSNARDKIRQMILENALDDRHDLSGNTVFGLKFDTSVLPGSQTKLNPTVVVRMDANPLDDLEEPDQYAKFFSYSDLSRPDEYIEKTIDALPTKEEKDRFGDVVELLKMNDESFEAWRINLEGRINHQLSSASQQCGDVETDADSLFEQQILDQEFLDQHLCTASIDKPTVPANDTIGDPPVIEINKPEIDRALKKGYAVSEALAFTLRVPQRDLIFAKALQQRMYKKAEHQCRGYFEALEEKQSPDAPRLHSLFSDGLEAGLSYQPLRRFFLPGGLAPLFQLQVDAQTAAVGVACGGVDLQVKLNRFSVPLIAVEQGSSPAAFYAAGLEPLECEIAECQDDIEIWVPSDLITVASSVLQHDTLETVFSGVTADDSGIKDWQVCVDDGGYFQLEVEEADEEGEEFVQAGEFVKSSPDDQPEPYCATGVITNFEIGPYHFLRKMSEVESYIYATFPRGDVTGVVSETNRDSSASGQLGLPQGNAGLELAEQNQTRSTQAKPSLINFASGDQHELFDFGWSIVKDGPKEPMVASQLVLVSVPAYLTELKLDILKGFLDVDEMPSDWAEWRKEYEELTKAAKDGQDGSIPDPEQTKKQREDLLQKRVERLFTGWEPRTIELRIPPDYGALDNVLFGVNGLGGPLINTTRLKPDECYEFDEETGLTLPIPGDRLWRSTVVTLDGKRADRIEVLPDMRGILAVFSPPEKTENSETEVQPASEGARTRKRVTKSKRLTVWTSEGSAWENIPFCETVSP